MLFHRLSLEAFCHATEDAGKVKEAMLRAVPPELRQTPFKEEKLEGSFGNDILIFALEFSKQGDMKKVVDFIKAGLPKEDLRSVDIDEHVTDDDEFWLRLDKQKACEGELALGGDDTIQLKGKVAAFPANRRKAISLMELAWS